MRQKKVYNIGPWSPKELDKTFDSLSSFSSTLIDNGSLERRAVTFFVKTSATSATLFSIDRLVDSVLLELFDIVFADWLRVVWVLHPFRRNSKTGHTSSDFSQKRQLVVDDDLLEALFPCLWWFPWWPCRFPDWRALRQKNLFLSSWKMMTSLTGFS